MPFTRCGIASDHVHVVVKIASTITIATLMQHLKGASAHQVNTGDGLSSRLRWQNGYWAESLAPVDADPLLDYWRRQREHHDDSHPAEMWQMAGR